MAEPKKFYRTTFSIDVLSEEPLGDCLSLAVIDEMISTGPCVGFHLRGDQKELTPKEAADALYEAGSEPGFFQLDDEGKDV